MPFPYIFTFYSYKGGVGRSMAVMNVAYTLAGWGRHVLLLDMDLEAPGLTGFLTRNQELAPVEHDRPDVLDLLQEAIRAVSDAGTVKEKVAKLPPLSNFIRSVAEEKLAALKPKMGQLGRLDVLGTDEARSYFDRLAALDLRKLGHEGLVALSNLLHFYFKAYTFPQRPLGIENFEPPIDTPYDYVLVDSRTGMTETGGLCVGPLSDRLVVLTSLNDQNVRGTLTFLREAGINPVPRPENDEKWDDADTVRAPETENASLGPKPTIVVASPVPTGEVTYRRQRLNQLEAQLGIRPVSLSYHPLMALIESFFVRDYPEEPLANEYRVLTTRVLAQIGDDPQTLSRKSQDAGNREEDFRKAIRLALRIAPIETELGKALLGTWGNRVPSGGPGPEMRHLHAFLSVSAELRYLALFNWAVELFELAKAKTGDESEMLLQEAGRKYSQAVQITSNPFDALFNWGSALALRGKLKTGEERSQLFEEAGRKFAEALRIKLDANVFYNWGNTLSEAAKTKTGEESERLFEEAGRKYEQAVLLQPDLRRALNNWANTLSERAKAKAAEESFELFALACQKYAEAVRLLPADPIALTNWGTALIHQSRAATADASVLLLGQAREKLLEAERLRPGSGAYNLACVAGLQGDATEAVSWLRLLESLGQRPSAETIAAEKDFDRVRHHPDFVAFTDSAMPSSDPPA